jgi:hypothetical protein
LRGGAVVVAGQQEERVDEVLKPGGFGDGPLGELGPGGAVRMGQADFEGRTDTGQRGAQFVGGVATPG